MEAAMLKFGPEHSEKRGFTRMAIKSELTFSIPGGDRTCTGYCHDLSHTGINFMTEQELSQGQSLEIAIDTKDTKFEPMRAIAEVVRVEMTENRYRVGCRILEFK